jgi:hypothetical protein
MAYILMPKRRQVPLATIKAMTQNNWKVDPPSNDAIMMQVLRREAQRKSAYGHCGKPDCKYG